MFDGDFKETEKLCNFKILLKRKIHIMNTYETAIKFYKKLQKV